MVLKRCLQKNYPSKIQCFCGADGAGKTTLATLYALWLRNQGLKVRVSWLRGTHTIASIIARFLRKFRVFEGSCNPYYNICIPVKLKQIWVWIEFFSMLPIFFLRFLIPSLLGYVVIGERGLIDFVVWLIITLRDPNIIQSLVSRFVLVLSQRTCFNIYVYADLGVLLARRKHSRDEHLLPIQLIVYNAIVKAFQIPVIDTSVSTISESMMKILKVIGAKNERRVF